VAAVAAAIAVGTPLAARAAHPMITEDAGTLGRGARQLELGVELSRDLAGPGGARERDDAGQGALTVGVGLRDDLDLAAGVAGVWSRVEREGGPLSEGRGLGDAVVALKWRALEAGGFALALRPALAVPTGDANRGLGTGGLGYGLTAVASRDLGRIAFHANAGWCHDGFARREDREARRADRFRASVAATARVAKPLLLVADVGAETNPDRASAAWPAYGLGGIVFSVRADLDLDVGVKVGLSAPAPDVAGLAGLTWRF
jgi:hypothetical protein